MSEPTKILLDESELPRRWYNVLADLPSPPPPVLHPGTLQPVGPAGPAADGGPADMKRTNDDSRRVGMQPEAVMKYVEQRPSRLQPDPSGAACRCYATARPVPATVPAAFPSAEIAQEANCSAKIDSAP